MIDTTLNVIVKKEKSVLTSHQKTFNRLIKTVKDLQIKQEATSREIDQALQFYYDTIKPGEALLSHALIERIKIAHQFYKNPKALSKTERELFKIWLTDEIDQVCTMSDLSKMPDEIKMIFKELNGVDYKESLAEKMETIQEQIRDEFGMDVDLSDIDPQGSPEDILRNIFLKMGKSAAQRHESFRETPKTKKQLEKESKMQAVKEMQSKSLHSIYKQLVRVLHPDLEQDSQKRIWKEELMKKLTTAYDNNDLYALLSIEMEWMNSSVAKMQSQNDADLKIYNAILKDQIAELQVSIDMLFMHPRNLVIQRFYRNGFDGVSSLKKKAVGLKQLIQETQEMIPHLQTKQAKTIFKGIIQERLVLQNFMAQGRMACQCGAC
jgi:hypothetical protein